MPLPPDKGFLFAYSFVARILCLLFLTKKEEKNVQNMLLPSTTALEHKLGLSPFTSHWRIVGED